MSRLETRNPDPACIGQNSGPGSVGVPFVFASLEATSNGARVGDKSEAALTRMREQWPAEFRDGARCGFLKEPEGPRDPGGYPRGFQRWPLERRNAWFAGFNVGFRDRLHLSKAVAA
jgi:hypothetical protein